MQEQGNIGVVDVPFGPDTAQPGTARTEQQIYARVVWRLLPFLFLCYVCAYLDRINVSFAKLQMMSDLSLSDAVYGLGAGIFFVGYLVFEIPSNLILLRVGARRWIARIMVTWGMLSVGMMFVHSETSFYVMRFLLGVSEAGFIPAILLYLTYWFPASRRSKVTGSISDRHPYVWCHWWATIRLDADPFR